MKSSPSGKPGITEDDIQTALRRFTRKGGLIRRLPPQVAPARVTAPGRGCYDTVEAIIAKMGLLN
jgi:hypothetical protein